MGREQPLGANSGRETSPHVHALETESYSREHAVDRNFVGRPGDTALAIKQQAVERVAEAPSYARDEIGGCRHDGFLTRKARRKSHALTAFQVRARSGAFDPDD